MPSCDKFLSQFQRISLFCGLLTSTNIKGVSDLHRMINKFLNCDIGAILKILRMKRIYMLHCK